MGPRLGKIRGQVECVWPPLVTVTGLLAERTFQSILRDAAIGVVVCEFIFICLLGICLS